MGVGTTGRWPIESRLHEKGHRPAGDRGAGSPPLRGFVVGGSGRHGSASRATLGHEVGELFAGEADFLRRRGGVAGLADEAEQAVEDGGVGRGLALLLPLGADAPDQGQGALEIIIIRDGVEFLQRDAVGAAEAEFGERRAVPVFEEFVDQEAELLVGEAFDGFGFGAAGGDVGRAVFDDLGAVDAGLEAVGFGDALGGFDAHGGEHTGGGAGLEGGCLEVAQVAHGRGCRVGLATWDEEGREGEEGGRGEGGSPHPGPLPLAPPAGEGGGGGRWG